jgi:hypothetical protein
MIPLFVSSQTAAIYIVVCEDTDNGDIFVEILN